MLFSLVEVTAVRGSSKLRGCISPFLGLAIGLVGIDSLTGEARATFGLPQLSDGIDIVVIAVRSSRLVKHHGSQRICARNPPRSSPSAGGAELPAFLSDITEKNLSKHPEELGRGAIEGVAGPEAANNASAAGTLVPMLALGLLIWTLIASLFIGNFLLLGLNLPLAPLWAKLLRTPRPYLYAGILFFATPGAFAVNIQPLDLVLLLVFGLLGLMMRRLGLPVLPLIIGVILGPRIDRRLGLHGAAAVGAAGAQADAPRRGNPADRRR